MGYKAKLYILLCCKKRLFTDYVLTLECDNDIYILKVGLITADEPVYLMTTKNDSCIQ